MKILSLPVLILLFLATVFVSVGVVVGLVFGKPWLDQARQTSDWPHTPGVVIESELDESQDTDNEEGTRRARMYSAHVAYSYQLDGGEFQSNRIWYGSHYSTSDRSEMYEIVKQYPVGSAVTVYYDPTDPSQAVLMPGAFMSSYVMFAIGMVFLGVGGILLLILFYVVLKSAMSRRKFDSRSPNSGLNEFNERL